MSRSITNPQPCAFSGQRLTVRFEIPNGHLDARMMSLGQSATRAEVDRKWSLGKRRRGDMVILLAPRASVPSESRPGSTTHRASSGPRRTRLTLRVVRPERYDITQSIENFPSED